MWLSEQKRCFQTEMLANLTCALPMSLVGAVLRNNPTLFKESQVADLC